MCEVSVVVLVFVLVLGEDEAPNLPARTRNFIILLSFVQNLFIQKLFRIRSMSTKERRKEGRVA